jgi:hypothetical protein
MRQLDSSLSDTMAGMSVGAQHAKLLPSNSREEALAALAGGATVVAGNRRLARSQCVTPRVRVGRAPLRHLSVRSRSPVPGPRPTSGYSTVTRRFRFVVPSLL